MTGHDRTAEFLATSNSKREKPQWIQQRRNNVANGASSNNMKANKLALDPQYRDFMRQSQDCARKIAFAFEKLEKLTQLARRRTVFDDGELNKLIADIRQDISDSKNQLDVLQNRYEHKQKHSESIVTTLQQRLANATSNFKSTLEVRSRSVQQQTARHELYAGPSTSQQSYTNPLQPIPYQDPYAQNSSGLALNMGDPGDPQTALRALAPYPGQQQQQLLINDQIDLTDRADKMHLIESTIVELGTVFNQLAQMVQSQGETITRIDMNISETAGNVESAHEALLSYFASINNNRWLILKVFGVLFFFFIVFVMFAT